MLNVEEAKRSVEVLHDQFFMGRQLVVSGAKTKEHEDAMKEETADAPEAPAASSEKPTAFPTEAPAATPEEPTAFPSDERTA